MNLRKIKELITDIAVDLEMTNVDTGAYIDSAKEKVKEALAEFEKPAEKDSSLMLCARDLQAIHPSIATRSWIVEAMQIIQQYAEAYHQRRCAECKNAK